MQTQLTAGRYLTLKKIFWTFLSAALFATASQSIWAKSTPYVLFHPYDKTLSRIGSYIEDPVYSYVDIAMYSFEVDENNAVIKAFLSPETQARIKSGLLKPRMIFQGYGTVLATKVSVRLEKMGIQVRWLKSSRQVHHKFGILYNRDFSKKVVITGSANWNRSSEANYDENILFIENSDHVTKEFFDEFELLWRNCTDFESEFDSVEWEPEASDITAISPVNYSQELQPLDGFFNSQNFNFSGPTIHAKPDIEGYTLTREIVKTIDNAKSELLIATTRIRSLPIYNALMRAHSRGVEIKIISNQTEYPSIISSMRKDMPLCEDEFDKTCSTNVNHLYFLDKNTKNEPNSIALRIKYFFSKSDSANLIHQMHHKYFIIDRSTVYTGTFNWSYSAEYNYMENILRIDGGTYPTLVKKYTANFNKIWKQGRDQLRSLQEIIKTDTRLECSFTPIAMTLDEIDDVFYKTEKKYLGELCL